MWLTAGGHDVRILDLAPSHVERARARGFAAQTGDARSLPYDDETFDVVLLLDPLYHLIDEPDRATALSEPRRPLRPGGLVAAAAIGRVAVALDYLRRGRLDPEAATMAARIVANGHDDTGFGAGTFYFHTTECLRRELIEAGFHDIVVRGLDGPAWPLIDPAGTASDPLLDHVVAIANMSDADESTVGVSVHLLALANA